MKSGKAQPKMAWHRAAVSPAARPAKTILEEEELLLPSSSLLLLLAAAAVAAATAAAAAALASARALEAKAAPIAA